MTTGVLLYCFDTPNTQYSRITDRCIQLLNHYIKLPITVVTDEDTQRRIQSVCDFKIIKIKKNNTKLSKPWYNLERHLAFEHSPYDKTLVIDVDYFCFSNKLLKLLNTNYDFLIHTTAHDVITNDNMTYERECMLDLVWATVLIFKKTPRVKAIFDTVKMIQHNYQHFCNLYRISYRNFRNDYAFAIALNQIAGHRDYNIIADSIATVPADTNALEINENGAVIESKNKIIKIEGQDLHFLNKEIANV